MNDFSVTNWLLLSDDDILKSIGQFIQQQRIQQNLTQNEVAERANISRSTLSLLERGENSNLGTLIQVLRVLDSLDVLQSFEVQEEISPIEMAKLRKKQTRRKRASGGKQDEPNDQLEW